MIYDKKSIDYQINMEAFREMEEVVPMTVSERRATRKWVQRGHELESNPWNYYDTDGLPLNYLQAHRLHHGYSSGPWDYWKGPETQLLWADDLNCFLTKDEL